MSQRHIVQDATGVAIATGPNKNVLTISNKDGVYYNASTGVPNNSKAGFVPGALVVNPAGSVGSVLYVNTGTVTSSTWVNIA